MNTAIGASDSSPVVVQPPSFNAELPAPGTSAPPLSKTDAEKFEEAINLIQKNWYNQGKLKESYEIIVDLAARNPESGYPYAAFAELHYALAHQGNSSYAEALKAAQQALKMDPGIAAAHVVISKILLKKGNKFQAGFAARKAISLEPDRPDAMYAMARVAEATKQYEESESWYRKCIATHTDNVRKSNIYGWLGDMLGHKKPADIEGATDAHIQSAELVFETGVSALNRTGHFLAFNTTQYDRAIYYLEKAQSVSNYRSSPVNLGLAYYFKWGEATRYPERYEDNPVKPLNPEEIEARTGVSPEYAFVESPLGRGEPYASIALLERGYIKNVDIVPKSSEGTALISAAYGNHQELAELLMEKGANVNAKDSDFQATAIFYATKNQNLEMVKLLVENGARLNLRDNKGTPLAEYAINRKSGDRISIIRYFLEQGIDTSIINGQGESLLFAALYSGNTEVFQLLITEYDADVNAKTGSNTPILTLAAVSSGMTSQKMLKILLEEGADPWVKYGIADVVTVLLDPGSDPNQYPAFKGNAELILEARKTVPKPENFDTN